MTNQSNETFMVVHSLNVNLDSEYVQWLHEIKQRFRNAQIKAAVKVNSEQLLFNWRLGRDLVIRRVEEKWGKGIVKQVSLDLQAEFPNVKGFSTSNLWYMKNGINSIRLRCAKKTSTACWRNSFSTFL